MFTSILRFIKFILINFLTYKNFFYNFNNNKYSREISKNGYTVIHNFLNSKECELIRKEIDLYLKKNLKKVSVFKNYDYRIFSFHKVSKKTNKILKNKFLSKIVLNYENKDKINYSFTLAAKLINKPNNNGSGNGWHRDNTNARYPKALIYLKDCNIKNGPFEYVPKSHKLLNILNFILLTKIDFSKKKFSNKPIKHFFKSKKIVTKVFTEKKGTAIIFDSMGLHRGRPIYENNRYALTNYYYCNKDDSGKGFKHI